MTTSAPPNPAAAPAPPHPSPPQWTTGRLVAHHLLPGAAALVAFVPLALLLRGSGYPLMVALFLSILVGEVPAAWYLMLRASRAEVGAVPLRGRLRALFPWRAGGALLWLGVGLPLALVSMILMGASAALLEPAIHDALFGWVPGWLVLEAGPAAFEGASADGLRALWILSGVVGVGLGGVTQELYHRGFLLPRSAHLSAGSVPFNAGLFAMGHLHAPWGWPGFFLLSLPWAWAVRRWRSLEVGMVGHVGMLFLGWLGMTAMVFGWVTPP